MLRSRKKRKSPKQLTGAIAKKKPAIVNALGVYGVYLLTERPNALA